VADGVGGGKPLLEARVRLRADGSALGAEAVQETQKATQQAADVAKTNLTKGYREGAKGGAREGARAAAVEVQKTTAASAEAGGKVYGKRFGARAGAAIQDEFKSQASGLGKTLVAAFALEKGIGLLKDSVAVASDLNEIGSALGVTFGPQGAAQVTQWSQTTAKDFGLATLAAQQANSQFGIFAKSAGLSGDKAVEFSTTLTGLAGDLTSFYNPAGGTAQSIEAIGAALRGETEPIRAFGVLLDDATLRQEALRLGLVKTTKDALTPQQRVMAAYSQILKQTSNTQGDFARTSDSLANSQRTLGNEFQDLKATLGQGLAPVVSDTTKGLRDLFTAVNKIPADGVAGKLKPLLFGGVGQFTIGYNLLRDGITKVSGAFEDTVPPATHAAAAIKTVSTSMGENSGAAERNGESTAKLYTLYDGSAEKAAEFAKQQKRLNDALTDNPFLDTRDAARAYQEALQGAKEAAQENGKGLDITTEKGRANQEALDGLASSALSYLDSINKQKGPGAEFQSALKGQRADLIRAGIRFGLTKEQARQYADRILRIPKSAVTKVNLAGVGSVNYSLDALLTRVNSLDGRRIQVYASAGNVREDRRPGRSTGGPVPGRPSEVDSLPYMLAPGEYVVRAREASKAGNRALLDAMNDGRPVNAAAASGRGVSGGVGSVDHEAIASAVTRGVVAAMTAMGPGRVVLDDAVVGRLLRSGGGLAGIDTGGW